MLPNLSPKYDYARLRGLRESRSTSKSTSRSSCLGAGLREKPLGTAGGQLLERTAGSPRSASRGRKRHLKCLRLRESRKLYGLCRVIINALRWRYVPSDEDVLLAELTDEQWRLGSSFATALRDQTRRFYTALRFDPADYRAASFVQWSLPDTVKDVLRSEPSSRTEETLATVANAIRGLTFLEKETNVQPSMLAIELAKMVVLLEADKGHIVIKQGRPATYCYFILSGTVDIYRKELDITIKDANKDWSRLIHMQVLGRGAKFGELALITDDGFRHATVVCREHSEFLCIDKSGFDAVFQNCAKENIRTKLQTLRGVAMLSGLSEGDVMRVSNASELKTFDKSKMVMNYRKPYLHLHIIVNGSCKIVREAYFSTSVAKVLPLTRSAYLQAVRCGTTAQVQRRLLAVHSLSDGEVFGYGETPEDTFIVASDFVKCMLIPHSELRRLVDHDAIARSRRAFEGKLPSPAALADLYSRRIRWLSYRQSVLARLVAERRRRHLDTASADDVPQTIASESASPRRAPGERPRNARGLRSPARPATGRIPTAYDVVDAMDLT